MSHQRKRALDGGVIWITGYSGSGKTTVARRAEAILRRDGFATVLLDGDDLRSIFGGKWQYGREERVELSRVYFRLCSHLASQGLTVIIAAVAMYDEARGWFKAHIPRALEVYLQVPEDERLRRDRQTSKRVYDQAGTLENLYDEPVDADLVIDNFGPTEPEDAAVRITARYRSLQSDGSIDMGRSAHWQTFYAAAGGEREPSLFARTVAGQLLPGGSLLEIGCGNGRDAAFLAACRQHVTAIDVSAQAISLCRATHADQEIEFIAEPLPAIVSRFPSRFDTVYSRFSIHAMTRSEEAQTLAGIHDVLRPSGRLFIECRSINDPLARKGEVISPTERIHGHYRRFIIREELAAAVTEAGLAVTECIESTGFAPFKDEDPMVIRLTARKP